MPSKVFWIYGLSGAGKSTLARTKVEILREQGRQVLMLDGDEVRQGLSSDLGYDDAARDENLRRAAEVAALACSQGIDVVAAFMTPLRRQRKMIASILKAFELEFHWVNCPLEICKQRDPHGIYMKAACGEVKNVPGVDGVFEPPVTGLY